MSPALPFLQHPNLYNSCIRVCNWKFSASFVIGVGRGGGGQGGPGGARAPPNNLRGGGNIPFGPPNNPPVCTGKTIPLNTILEFSILSYIKMRNVIIWH